MAGRIKTIGIPYRPMPKQAKAHALAAKYRGYCGGWGNGKTSWGCVETVGRLHEYPGTKAIVARKTRPELKSTTWDMLMNGDPGMPGSWEGIPRELIETYNKSDLYIKFRNGSEIYGLPLDDPAKLENFNLGFFWIDQAEEIEEDIFLKFHGRMRQRRGPREGILTWNPAGHNWLWRRFIDPERKLKWHKLYKCIQATTYDNFNLPKDYFDQFDGLPDAWIQRFVFGSHEVFVGQIFTDYDSDIHVVQPFRIPDEWQRWSCFDPGMRHEAAASWVALDPVGNAYYYREHLEPNKDAAWWAEKMFEMEAEDDFGGPDERIDRHLIGPESQQRAQSTGKSVLDIFNEYGRYPELSDKNPSARISKITEFLRPNEQWVNPWTLESPSPKLFIFDTCDKLKQYLPQYRWRPQRTNYAEEDSPEQPRKKDDHNIDNLGHILLAFQGLPEPPNANKKPEKSFDEQVREECWEEALALAEANGQALHEAWEYAT